MFDTLAAFRTAIEAFGDPDRAAMGAARAHDAQLTKPAGSLGRLEDLAAWYAGWRPVTPHAPEAVEVAIFAGNHGIAAQGVSAFPQAVTVQMVENFRHRGAAVNQLARVAGARVSVHALDLDRPTGDITQGPAMSEAELCAALSAGWNAVPEGCDLFVAGEMGIGNTAVAAGLAAALFGGTAANWVGRGTGLDDAGLERKAEAVGRALERHAKTVASGDPLEILRVLGGREIAAMTGAMARARALRVPVLLDGFIASAAAAVLFRAVPGGLDHVVAGHCSDEAGHAALLQALGLDPLLWLGLRLGEGSGATLAIPVLRAALACHSGMATFDAAGVSGKD